MFYVFRHKEPDIIARDKVPAFSFRISTLDEKIKPVTVIGHNKEVYFNTAGEVNVPDKATTIYPVDIKSRMPSINGHKQMSNGWGNKGQVSSGQHCPEIRNAFGTGSCLMSSLLIMDNKNPITVGGAPAKLYTLTSGAVMQRATEDTGDPVDNPGGYNDAAIGSGWLCLVSFSIFYFMVKLRLHYRKKNSREVKNP